jgi:hypothetical protein
MRNIFRTLTLATALGALTPLAAEADVGLHMYQPSPLTTQTHHDRTAANTANVQNGQTHNTQRNG